MGNQFLLNPMKDSTDFLEIEQVNDMINHARNERDRLLILILSRTGRRIGEIVTKNGITPLSVDKKRNLIYFNILKKRERRLVEGSPISESLCNSIIYYISSSSINPQDPVFPITTRRAQQIVKKIREDAMIGKKVTCKTFRHTFAVLHARNMKSLADGINLKNALSHSHFGITENYLKFNVEARRGIYKQVWGEL